MVFNTGARGYARAIKLYNLCSLIVSKQELETIGDNDIKKMVLELKNRANDDPELQNCLTDESDVVLSALDCTHAIVRAIFGDGYELDRRLGLDQATQTAVIYCAMALIGTERFLEFAQAINLQDPASSYTKR